MIDQFRINIFYSIEDVFPGIAERYLFVKLQLFLLHSPCFQFHTLYLTVRSTVILRRDTKTYDDDNDDDNDGDGDVIVLRNTNRHYFQKICLGQYLVKYVSFSENFAYVLNR